LTSFQSIGGIPVDVFQGLPSNSVPLLDIIGNSKEISQHIRKEIVDLHKSGSSLGAIFKRLKVPRSSVQKIMRKYEHHRNAAVIPLRKETRLLEMNVLWCEKCKSIPEQQQRTL
jgi:allophanate hydrolase subunit 1